MLKRFASIIFLFLPVCISLAQTRTTVAVKTASPPKIDGNLDDPAWQEAPVLSDFIQNIPNYGQPAIKNTEVRILYDNTAIYIGAYLYDDPAQIRKQITSRDAEQRQDVDYFSVFIDTYDDHQNGFQFLVTSNNVQTDSKLSQAVTPTFGLYGDLSWDAVWESKVKMQKDGWTVEMKIPYFSLRFAKKDLQDWGIQFLRFFRRINESDFWNPVDPKVDGFENQFGLLKGLKNIQPPLRLSFSPYLATGYRRTPETNGYLDEWLRNGGMDMKWGLNESFTLDATLIPDFGQVVSDNVINNLTPYEVRFTENRPFFTEGTELFNKAGLFYSRRVGAIPSGYDSVLNFVSANPNWEISKNPSVTQLYNGIKFSGRTQDKLGIGIFNAVTAPIHAKIHNTVSGKDSVIDTEPLGNYNIIVLDQALKGRSYLTFTNTDVLHNGFGRDANVAGLDLALYDKNNKNKFQLQERYSKIWKADAAEGFRSTISYGKVSGNWQYLLYNDVMSDNYNPNDLGYLAFANKITYRANLTYHQFTATDRFVTYLFSIEPKLQYIYKPYAYNRFDITATAFWVFRNFWDFTFIENVVPGNENNYFELRTPGRYLRFPSNYFSSLFGSSDSRKKLFWSYNFNYAISPKFSNTLVSWDMGFRYRFSNKFSLILEGNSNYEKNQLGFAFVRETNGDPIAGFRNNTSFTSVISGTYNFNSRLNLTIRTRHYWNKVDYLNFHDVDQLGNLADRPFIPGLNENVNIFNVDGFLTWDFRLGSQLIIGYKNWLGNNEVVNITGENNYFKNLDGTLKARHGNELTVRFIYYLNYNQLRKK